MLLVAEQVNFLSLSPDRFDYLADEDRSQGRNAPRQRAERSGEP
jgi:hypothetical protein